MQFIIYRNWIILICIVLINITLLVIIVLGNLASWRVRWQRPQAECRYVEYIPREYACILTRYHCTLFELISFDFRVSVFLYFYSRICEGQKIGVEIFVDVTELMSSESMKMFFWRWCLSAVCRRLCVALHTKRLNRFWLNQIKLEVY